MGWSPSYPGQKYVPGPRTARTVSPEERDYLAALGTRIRLLRSEKGMLCREVAEAAGLERSTLSNIERGYYRITPYRLVLVAYALGADPAYLITGRRR